MSEDIKNFFDFLSLGTSVAVITSLIPVITGLLSIVWIVYRIYDLRLSVKIKEKELGE